ncbi:HTTM domain-containing protein [Polyangium sorediatum]|uniref:HTTM domain-containing protein n=1 Tax=Polyangium sorediatum TaxID=889274 RepID=A0ABT6P356_9BACT|nr:HTTM domain-containing protein [Polyangium sorediatum]MDI1435040.1 HTTM domain-containing protein [Polyangium sorediatum]
MERSILDELAVKARVRGAVDAFLFAPATARPLAVLRIGLALVLLVQAATLRPEVVDWFSRDGLFQGIGNASSASFGPRVHDLLAGLSWLGLGEGGGIRVLGAAYVAALALLAVGLGTRLAALVAWFLHWTFMLSADPLGYGMDRYAHIFLFYLIWVPAGRAISLDATLFRPASASTSTARFGLRVMQIHMAISYLASGIEKASGIDWWDGELLFRALSFPDCKQFDMSWLAFYPAISQLACVGTLVVELGYCVFIWPRRTRRLWLAAILALHVGIAVFLGLHFFGAIMFVLNFALFGVSPEPRPDQAAFFAGAEAGASSTLTQPGMRRSNAL